MRRPCSVGIDFLELVQEVDTEATKRAVRHNTANNGRIARDCLRLLPVDHCHEAVGCWLCTRQRGRKDAGQQVGQRVVLVHH